MDTVAVVRQSTRDRTLDVVRGACIVSMTTAHLAQGTWIRAVTHPIRWTDGAFGFLFLAGLVMGLVQRRRFESRGTIDQAWLIDRAILIYLAQVGLLATAVLLKIAVPDARGLPNLEAQGGIAATTLRTLLLQLRAPNAAILPLYAVLFLGAVVVLRLLARQQLALALCGSGIIFALGQLIFRSSPDSAVGLGLYFYWPSWQVAFTASLVIGWYWEARQISAIVTQARTLLIAGGVIAVGVLLGGVARQGTVWGTTTAPWTVPFGKYNLGFGAFVLGVAVLAVAYNAARCALAQQYLKVGAEFLERLGTRSLACFVISSLVLFVQVAFLPYPPNVWWGALLTAISLALGWLWATWRQRTTRLR